MNKIFKPLIHWQAGRQAGPIGIFLSPALFFFTIGSIYFNTSTNSTVILVKLNNISWVGIRE
jgi:hypothetical protein